MNWKPLFGNPIATTNISQGKETRQAKTSSSIKGLKEQNPPQPASGKERRVRPTERSEGNKWVAGGCAEGTAGNETPASHKSRASSGPAESSPGTAPVNWTRLGFRHAPPTPEPLFTAPREALRSFLGLRRGGRTHRVSQGKLQLR